MGLSHHAHNILNITKDSEYLFQDSAIPSLTVVPLQRIVKERFIFTQRSNVINILAVPGTQCFTNCALVIISLLLSTAYSLSSKMLQHSP